MMPARWFSAAVNGAFPDPLIVRLEGIACALLFLALIWRLTARVEPSLERRGASRAVAFALLGLGVLPLMLTMSRPEQPLILATGAAILLALGGNRDASASHAWLRSAGIVALAGIALSYHLKGVLYAVVMLAALGLCARDRATILPRALGAALVAVLAALAAQYWSARFACPGDPVLAKNLAGQNIAAALSQGGGLGALRQLAANVLPFEYVLRTLPVPYPMSQWLPWNLFPLAARTAFSLIVIPAWLGALWLGIGGMVGHWRREGRRGLIHPAFVLAATILACILVWGASQTTKNDYESAHVLPMLAIVAVLGLSLRAEPLRPRIPMLFVAAAALSAVGVVGFTARPFLATAAKGGYIAGQTFSYSGFGFPRTRADVERAMRAAGFPQDRRLRRVAIDDGTYFALQDSYMPIHRVGVITIWNGSVRDPAAYLLSRGSDGAVMRCANLTARLRAAAARSGEVCAVSADGLRHAVKP
jgi:hypothetical protein